MISRGVEISIAGGGGEMVRAMKLERLVGSKRVRVMCTDKGDTFEFV